MKRCLPVLLLAYLLTGCGIFFPVENNPPLPPTITPIHIPTTTPTLTVLPTSGPLPTTPTKTALPTSDPLSTTPTKTALPTSDPLSTTPTVMVPPTSTSLPTIPAKTALPTSSPLPPTITATLLPTSTPKPAASPNPTATATPEPLLQLQLGSPRFLPAFLHEDAGCAWRGVAGQVFALGGQGMAQAVVLVTGEAQGQAIEYIALSAAESDYGPGGYEVSFSGVPADKNLSITIQVFDLQGSALSAPFSFQMPAACDQNLALVSFQAAGGS